MDVIKTRVANLSLRNDGIIELTISHEKGLTIEDLKQISSAIEKLSGGVKIPVLGRSINYTPPSREVRNFAAGEETAKFIKAAATIIANPLTRIAANFFLKINKPPFPFQTFTTEQEAIIWLKKMNL